MIGTPHRDLGAQSRIGVAVARSAQEFFAAKTSRSAPNRRLPGMDIFANDTTDTPLFRLHPIPPETIAQARTTGVDATGHPVERQTAAGREPLRCCLRNALPGEELILFGYRPVLPVSPYVETGAVFTHAEPCAGPPVSGTYPSDWIGRPQVLRAYDERGWIHPASTMDDGNTLAATVADVLAQPGVVQVHLRNVVYGCINAVATPAGGASQQSDQPAE